MSRPVRYEDEMPGDAATDVAEPEGHDSWLAHFRHACETDPALFGMVRKYIEDMEAQHGGGGEDDAMEGGADAMPEPGGEEEPVPDQYSMVGRAGDYIRRKMSGSTGQQLNDALQGKRSVGQRVRSAAEAVRSSGAGRAVERGLKSETAKRVGRDAARGAAGGAAVGAGSRLARGGSAGDVFRDAAVGAGVGGVGGAIHGAARANRKGEGADEDGTHRPPGTGAGNGDDGFGGPTKVGIGNTQMQYAQDQVPVAYQAALQYMENRLSSVEAFAVEKDREIARLQAVNARKDSELIVYQLQLEGFKAIADPRDAETLTRHLASLSSNDRQAKVQEIVACWERDSSLAYAAQGAPTGDFLPVSREQAESRQAATFDDSKLDVALRYMRANPGKAWEECQAYAMNGHAVQY